MLHLRQRLHDLHTLQPDMMVPEYIELTLSDEDKASLVERCVYLLLNGKQGSDEQSSVSPYHWHMLYNCIFKSPNFD